MMRSRILMILSMLVALASCDDGARQQLENELMLMQERLVELETQIADSQASASRLAAAANELEAYVRDVETEVIDLSAHVPRDLLVDLEATVGNAKTKVAEVRERAAALHAGLRPDYAEE